MRSPSSDPRVHALGVVLAASLGLATSASGGTADAAPPDGEKAAPEDTDPAVVEAHWERASEAFGSKDYDTAIEELEAALVLDPQPRFLYPLAQSLRFSGRCKEAIEYYRRYLDTSPPKQKQVDTTRKHIVRCQEEVRKEEEAAAAAAAAAEPTGPQGEGTAAQGDGGDPDRAGESGGPGGDKDDEGADEAQPRKWYASPLGGTLLAVGIAAGVTGGVLMGDARSKKRQAENSNDHAEFEDLGQSAITQDRAGLVLVGVGGAALLGAIITYAVLASKSKKGKKARRNAILVPSLDRGGAGLTMTGRF